MLRHIYTVLRSIELLGDKACMCSENTNLPEIFLIHTTMSSRKVPVATHSSTWGTM